MATTTTFPTLMTNSAVKLRGIKGGAGTNMQATCRAECIVLKFAQEDTFKKPTSTIDNYIPTHGIQISQIVVTTTPDGTPIWHGDAKLLSSLDTMSIMAGWYLENIFPLLHKLQSDFTGTSKNKMDGFGWWMFHPQYDFIQITGWKVARFVDNWHGRMRNLSEKIEAGEKFETVMQIKT